MPKFTVTATAPSRVAGRRVKPGDSLEITDRGAAYELIAGHIRPFEEPLKDGKSASEAAPKISKRG